MDSLLTPPSTPPSTPSTSPTPEQIPMTLHSFIPSAEHPTLGQHPPQQPDFLTPTTNWNAWAKSIELHAKVQGVWKYCDPDTPELVYHELKEPEKPHISTVRPEATSIVDLGSADFIELSACVDQYWRDYSAWENLMNRIRRISDLIESCVDSHCMGLIKNETDPRKRMVILAAACRPSRFTTLQPEWDNIQLMAGLPVIQDFFQSWNMFFDRCNEFVSHQSFANERALWDLLEQKKDPRWKWESLADQLWIKPPEDSRLTENSRQ